MPVLFLDDLHLPTYQQRILPDNGSSLLLGFLGYEKKMRLRTALNKRVSGMPQDIPPWEDLEIFPRGNILIPDFKIEDFLIPVLVRAIEVGGAYTISPGNYPWKSMIKILAERGMVTYVAHPDFQWTYTVIV